MKDTNVVRSLSTEQEGNTCPNTHVKLYNPNHLYKNDLKSLSRKHYNYQKTRAMHAEADFTTAQFLHKMLISTGARKIEHRAQATRYTTPNSY